MYLNQFCFVLVLVTVSASYFDEQLPLYLSDDILISKGITKRSLENNGQTENTKTSTGRGAQENESEIEDKEESGLVFLPSFGRRARRSITKQAESVAKTVKRDTSDENKSKSSTERKTNEKHQGSEIENEEESGLVFLPSFGRRSRRSIITHEDKDLLNSENNIVFLPSFKRNGFRRFRRDIDATNYRHFFKRSTLNGDAQDKKTKSPATEKNEELSDSDTVNGQESGLVFLPSFGRRSRRNVVETSSSSTPEQKAQKDTVISTTEENRDRVETTPLISSEKNKREVKNENSENKKTKLNDSEDDANGEFREESGLVFLPSFGRRSRRNVVERNSPSFAEQKTSTSSPDNEKQDRKQTLTTAKTTKREVTSENSEKKETKLGDSDQNANDESEEESGLVFLPSFGRRSRRSIVKYDDTDLLNSESNIVFLPSFKRNGFRRFRRDIDATNYRNVFKRSTEALNGDDKEKKTKSSITETNKELSDSDTVNGQESGLVFLPSFGRRSRRNVVESSSSSTPERKAQKDTVISTTEENRDKVEIKPLTSLEKTKREVENENSENKKTKLGDSETAATDESEEESGLVFLPSFSRRSRRSVAERNSPLSTKQKTSTISPGNGKQIKTPTTAKKSKREVNSENSEKKETKLGHLDQDANDESVEESGLVFLPSFGRRSRRSVVENSPSLSSNLETSTPPPKDENHNEEKIKRVAPTQKTKREVKNVNSEEKKKSNGAHEDGHDESEEESGLVFLPSFNKRTRRDVTN